MIEPVRPERITIAGKTLANATVVAVACREAGVPFFVACALVQKESGGLNVYGHDVGGALSGFPFEVNLHNFRVFQWLLEQGHTSNGVGPCQITYPGYFTQMEQQRLRPWVPLDNMIFGLRILAANHKATGTWEKAGARYNGGPKPNATALAYGADLRHKAQGFADAFGVHTKVS